MSDKLNLDNQEWKDYKNKFNKTYENENEEIKRYKIFLESKKTIEEHNAKYEKGEVSYEMGVNQFADRKTFVVEEETDIKYLLKQRNYID